MTETVAVVGPIADRWLWWGGADGPFGRALEVEQDVPGRAGKRQSFERGQIAWTSDQAMVTSVYLLGNEACFEWSRPQSDFDYYRLDIERDGVGLGQAAAQIRIGGDPEDEQYQWTRLQGFGHYTFVVKSCTSPLIGSDHCTEWTIPVGVDFGPIGTSPFPNDPPVAGVIADRWHELRAWSGPLGRPVAVAVTDDATGRLSQAFDHGTIQTVPSLGPGMVVAAFERLLPPPGSLEASLSIQLEWGGANTTPYNFFRVDVTRDGVSVIDPMTDLAGLGRVVPEPFEWADPNRASGQFTLSGPGNSGAYVFAVRGAFGLLYDPASFIDPAMFTVTHDYVAADHSQLPIEFPALNDSPEAAFASHRDRALSVAREYARTRPLRVTMRGKSATPSTEDDGVCLLAHFAAAAEERDFHPPGELPSLPLAHVALRQMQTGKTGTNTDGSAGPVKWHRNGDFDATLRQILAIAYRYGHLLTDAEQAYIRHRLVPPGLCFGHDLGIETVQVEVDTSLVGEALGLVLDFAGVVGDLGVPVVSITVGRLVDDLMGTLPESENHILMIESARYLINQLFLDFTADQRYDNNNPSNGLTEWLAQWLQRIAQHDFMEFNGRPYSRYSLHALMNLCEFARDESIRNLAQNILDYTMVRYALSSLVLRRVEPYRRLKEHQNRIPYIDDNGNLITTYDWLYSSDCDQLTGFGTAYFGDRDVSGHIRPAVPNQWAFIGVLAGTAAYRPPPQAYTLALQTTPAVQHRFYHGTRPKVTGTDDIPDGGLEIYYKSPSFLLSAGGMFLNSGYGRDDNLFVRYKDTAAAQATTLIPTRADVRFQDLIRFDPYPPGQNDSVNIGVHMGFACGGNLVIPQLWLDLSHATNDGPWTFLNLNTNLAGHGPLGFYVAAYRTPIHLIGAILIGLPQNLGLLYAAEAVQSDGTPLDFSQFVAATRDANQLPDILEYNAQYDFHTGDGHTFRAWLSTNGAKYSARVLAMDGDELLADLSQLPLAEGPFLQAPGGHDGVIHVLAPDCATPLVLDSHDAHAPTSTDPYEQCPDYWHRRAVAVTAMADQSLAVSIVRSSTDPAGAVRASRSAVGVLQDFQPPHSDALAYYSMLGRALVDLMWRLDAAGAKQEEIVDLTAPAIVAYLTAADQPTADTFTIASLLRSLSIFLSNRHDDEEAVEAQQAAAEILAGPPPAGNGNAFLALGADVAVTLAIRLVVAGHGDRVAAAVDAAIAAYQRAAAGPGADPEELAAEMRHAAAQLTSMGFAADGARLSAAADQISPPG